jgi:galactokinase/mevalonate kinase-like predicted kinase
LLDWRHEVARAEGALAGQVAWAGGGGLIVFALRPEERLRQIEARNGSGGASAVTFT